MPRRNRHPAVEAYIRSITSKGGKARAKKLTSEERKRIASTGGSATAKKRTPAERAAAARKASLARWARKPRD